MDPRYNGFFLMTGVTFLAFASGFSVCLFNLDEINACVEVANRWFDIFLRAGSHIIDWFFALVKAVMKQ
jgi:hypothetical protein